MQCKFRHVCSVQVCFPQNEPQLISRGLLRAPVLTDYIYICRYGIVHICTENECMKLIDGVCPISSRCYGHIGYSSYDKNNPKTWSREFRQNERLQQTPGNITSNNNKSRLYNVKRKEAVRQKISSYIINLLFSPNRQKLNENDCNKRLKTCQKQISIYYAECKEKGVPVNVIQTMMIRDSHLFGYQKLTILNFDNNVVEKYTRLILLVRDIVIKYNRPNIKIEHIILGTLYGMRQGYETQYIDLFPTDSFLLNNLPAINDLPSSFGIQKKNITIGKQIIQMSFDNAIRSGHQFNEFNNSFN